MTDIKLNKTLQIVKSKLNGMTFKEPVDIVVLDKLINSDLLRKDFNNAILNEVYENEKEQLLKYRKLIQNNMAIVKYRQSRNVKMGRVFPSVGLISIRREIRQTLTKHTMTDIDIENCHPVILQQICKQNKISCDMLNVYINKRENLLTRIQDIYLVDRDAAKSLFIQLMYFGSFKSWAKKYSNTKTKAIEYLKLFQKELNNIGSIIVKNNKHILEKVDDKHNIQ